MNTRFYVFLKFCLLLLVTTQTFALTTSGKRWDGFYGGPEIGGNFNTIKMQTILAPGGTYFDYNTDASQVDVAGNVSGLQRKFSGGVFGGYEHQFNNIVVGIEASANSLSINNSQSISDIFLTDPNIHFAVTQSLQANWEGALRLKLGYAQNNWLAYVTGGAAITNVTYTSTYSDNNTQPGLDLPGGFGSGTTSKRAYGWIVGAGDEYALNNTLAIKVEYLYSKFDNIATDYIMIPTPTLDEFHAEFHGQANLTVQSLLVGLSYRF